MHWGALDGADTYVEVGVLYCGLLRALEESGDVMSPIGQLATTNHA